MGPHDYVWPPPLDDVAANQRDEWNREGLHDWRHDMEKRLKIIRPHWRDEYDTVDEAALAILGKTPYAEY